jgi:hypothetical protein
MEIFFRDELMNRVFNIMAPLIIKEGPIICRQRANHTLKKVDSEGRSLAKYKPRRPVKVPADQMKKDHASYIHALVEASLEIKQKKSQYKFDQTELLKVACKLI